MNPEPLNGLLFSLAVVAFGLAGILWLIAGADPGRLPGFRWASHTMLLIGLQLMALGFAV